MIVENSGVVWTDSGKCGLWDPASFPGIVDYDTWDAALGEDDQIARHIQAGAFVPINIESDGAFQVLVRVGEPARLTERELEILKLIAQEYNNAQIASTLFISERTVETHRKNMLRKTNNKTIVGLMKYAMERQLI